MKKSPSRGTLHYINAIKGFSVLKIKTMNSRGVVLKNLKDICEVECATPVRMAVKRKLCDRSLPMAKRLKTKTCVDNGNSCSQLDENLMGDSFLDSITQGPSSQEMGQNPAVCSVSELRKEAETMHLSSTQSFSLMDKPDNGLVMSSQSSNDMEEIETSDRASASDSGLRVEGSRHKFPGLCSGRSISDVACRASVVSFSQFQMQTVKSITRNLVTELKSLKSLIEHTVLDEANRCTSMKINADEVKLAIKNAARVEKQTKKRVDFMARNCSRFWKIMSQPTEDAAAATATENITHEKRKRISFADEAGGELCHVKYF
ncbi:hypothetical protein POM88_019158 [Heracleum sosnowskyi]|uniref:Uncharacterized protein n=1 Tax=Heracleum sosnowskyi TaxID=360622 RepID=A0AAD8ISD7_9APIA|nr:hypothetical protein POM88_019158 [Heracleum sosnowskyi]